MQKKIGYVSCCAIIAALTAQNGWSITSQPEGTTASLPPGDTTEITAGTTKKETKFYVEGDGHRSIVHGTSGNSKVGGWETHLTGDSEKSDVTISVLDETDGPNDVYELFDTLGAITVGDAQSDTFVNSKAHIESINTTGNLVNLGETKEANVSGTLKNGLGATILVASAGSVENSGTMTIIDGNIANDLTNTQTGELNMNHVRSGKILNAGIASISGENDAKAIVNVKTGVMISGGEGSIRLLGDQPEVINWGTMTVPIVMGGKSTITNSGEYTGIVIGIGNQRITMKNVTATNEDGGTWSIIETPAEIAGMVEDVGEFMNKGTVKGDGGSGARDVYFNITNNGIIDVRENSIKIAGKYTGSDRARLITQGNLGGDDSTVNTLTIEGKAEGATKVKVFNISGTGGETVDGITIVKVLGGGAGEFIKDGRIVAGLYEYELTKVPVGEVVEWRLYSGTTPPEPPEPTPVPPEPTPPKPAQIIRPETGAYSETMKLANTLFSTREEQRRAVGDYADAVTGKKENSTLWMSQTGGHARNRDASGQLNNSYNTYAVQMGGTILTLPAGNDSKIDIGMQIGYGHARGDTRSYLTGYRARGTVTGYSTGVYSTWRQNKNCVAGGYVSTTLQYSWLKNQVKGDDLDAEKYDARGTTLSLEGGYDYAVWQGGEQTRDSVYIRPHAQITRMGVKADPHREANGTRVSQQGDGNVFSRTGMRVWMDKAVTNVQRIQPFVEANWVHNTRDFCTSMNGVGDCLAGNSNQAEVLAGVKGDVSPAVSVTAQAGGRFGSQASRDLAGTLNMSVKF
ncbi:autotransporter outer membrane beta-barrel domain-containing protein [Salmonella enterica]|nr:autotransporter outer membrane beta-barrel domain-containing protein [Salmonella enterica]